MSSIAYGLAICKDFTAFSVHFNVERRETGMSREDVPQRDLLQQQIHNLMGKATQRPMPQDQMGMIGFASTLLAAQMQSLLLQSGGPEPGTQEDQKGGEQE
jgi:hypothetical protein